MFHGEKVVTQKNRKGVTKRQLSNNFFILQKPINLLSVLAEF